MSEKKSGDGIKFVRFLHLPLRGLLSITVWSPQEKVSRISLMDVLNAEMFFSVLVMLVYLMVSQFQNIAFISYVDTRTRTEG